VVSGQQNREKVKVTRHKEKEKEQKN